MLLRVLLPSISDVVFVGIVGALIFTPISTRLLNDAGIGWHIRTGQWIIASHRIPHVDMFSATMQGKPWLAWEWLYDLLVGWLHNAAGLNAVVSFTAVVIAAVFAWAFRLLVERGTDVLAALALVLLAASASMIHFFARPHVLGWLFVLFWFWVLDSLETNAGRLAWLLPFVMLVWVNVHGGFLTGFVLLAIYWISAVWQWAGLEETKLEDFLEKLAAQRRVEVLTKTAAASLAATFINPYGWRLHVHIYRYLTNRFLMDHIEEFQSPNFHGIAERCFAALLLLTFVALALRARRVWLSEALLILFAVFSGLYASRNIPVSSLLLVMVIGPLVSETRSAGLVSKAARQAMIERHGFLRRMTQMETSLRGHLWSIIALIVLGWMAANGWHLGSRTVDAHFDAKRFPTGAVDYLATANAPNVLISPDYWGGYLIYRLYPKKLVGVDDRHDLYGEEFLKSYLKLIRIQPGWGELLREKDIPCVLAPRGSALNNILALQSDWQEVYRDDVAVVFVRRDWAVR